jgi:hypothetical protein
MTNTYSLHPTKNNQNQSLKLRGLQSIVDTYFLYPTKNN